MGNKIARTTQASATEYYLHDLPSSYNLVLKEVLGRGRFLKSILCKHDEGLVLVKVYFKRGDSIDLGNYDRRLHQIHEIFTHLDQPHVWPFKFWFETDKAAYLLRQYFFNNLHDRLSTRPFLSLVEKKWLSFQLLCAVKQCHENGVCHGDIKCENVLVTSWNWLYLTDFASFKPTYIPHDDPSDFSFFFDTGGRRRCYLAPERFYEHGSEVQVAQDAPLRPSMDIFSVGCVIAELFLEGQPLFELSQLLAYRRGQYDPSQHLEKIPDSGLRKMILHMIQLNPDDRFSADSYLKSYAGVFFPCYFSPFLHNFYSLLNLRNPDSRVLICQLSFQEILKQMLGDRTGDETLVVLDSTKSQHTDSHLPKDLSRNKQNQTTDRSSLHGPIELPADISNLLRDIKQNNRYSSPSPTPTIESVANSTTQTQKSQHISKVFQRNHHPFLKKITMKDLDTIMSDYDHQSDTFGMPFLPLPQDSMSCEGMVLIASLLCSCIRNIKLPHIKRSAILLLKSCSLYIDDDDRLQRVLPYVIAMLSDPAAIVRCAAIETLCDILPLVRDFPPSDAKIFPEYILPMLSMLPDDPEESVRICYASNISKLALTAYGFLIHSVSLSEAGNQNSDVQLAQLRKSIAEVIQELVMGPKQSPNIRRALLQDIGNLCWFFGQRQSNDFLLPILPAFLNDRDEQLRAVFYGQIVYVCFFVGQRSVEEYLLPYIEQALCDTTEGVMANALDCLTILCKSEFLRKRTLLEMIEHAFPLLCFPSQWVRRSAVSFIASSSESLGAVDSFVYLVPFIRPFLRRQPTSLAAEKTLFSCLKPAVSRQKFYQVLENSRSSDMLDRQRKIWYNKSSQSKHWESLDLDSTALQMLDLGENNSGLISPQTSISEKSSEGLPLYHFKYDSKRAAGIHPGGGDLDSSSMPWMDPLNKSINLANSVPIISIGNSTPQLHRVVHEVDDRESDQIDDNNSSVSEPLPAVGWRPRGVLVAHLQEHQSTVNDIAVSSDHSFFATASDDSSVKIWDSKRLEKDISFRSKLTYSLNGSRALCTTMLNGTTQVIVGSSDGTIHTFSVDLNTNISDVKKNRVEEGAVLTLLSNNASQMVLYSTQNCGVHLWDVRTNSNSWDSKVVAEEGYVSSLATGPCGNWFVSGTSRGVLTLWDLRFCIPVNTWQNSLMCPVEKICLLVPPLNSSLSTAASPLVYIAAGSNEVSLWNAENGSCHQVLRMANSESEAETSELPWALARPSNKINYKSDLRRNMKSKYRIEELQDPPPRIPGVRALLPLPGGDLLTGGTDLKIRRWDHNSPDRSYCVCGPSVKGVGNDDVYESKSRFGVQVVQESKRRTLAVRLTGKAVLAAAATDSGGCHRDSILSLATVKLNQRLLISSSRDGAVKVWK